MNKKIIFSFLATLALASVQLAEAQQGKTYRVGVLAPPGKVEELPAIKGLRDGLRDAGYVGGKNLQLTIPIVKTYDELRPIAKGYTEKRTDAIITYGGTSTGIAREATKEIPIIFIWGVRDPVGQGFVKSLARPEANITGLSSSPGEIMDTKRLELFKEAVPTMRRVTLLYNARGEASGHAMALALVREAAPKLGLTLNEKPAKSVGDADEAMRTVSKQTSDGIFIVSSGLFRRDWHEKINAVAMQKKLPVWGMSEEAVDQGALLSYEPDRYRIGHRGAWYVDRILKGAKPAELPVELPTEFELVINLKTARSLGITIPQSLLMRADRVIK